MLCDTTFGSLLSSPTQCSPESSVDSELFLLIVYGTLEDMNGNQAMGILHAFISVQSKKSREISFPTPPNLTSPLSRQEEETKVH
jgi:hypothetical protein